MKLLLSGKIAEQGKLVIRSNESMGCIVLLSPINSTLKALKHLDLMQ